MKVIFEKSGLFVTLDLDEVILTDGQILDYWKKCIAAIEKQIQKQP